MVWYMQKMLRLEKDGGALNCGVYNVKLTNLRGLIHAKHVPIFSCVCLLASMARSVNCLGRKKAVQVHLIGAKPIVQVKR